MIVRKLAIAAVVVRGPWIGGGSARAADNFAVDPAHSSVVFRVKHMNTSFTWGRFNEMSGSFALDDATPAASALSFEVKTASVDTANAKRDQHLKGPDFFGAVQYPTITFASKTVTSAGADAFDVAGDMTLHGVTRPLTVRVKRTGSGTNPMGKPIAGIEATFVVKRSDFGMSKMVGPVGDDIWVNVSIEGAKP